MSDSHPLYIAAIKADNEYMAELRHVYGNNAVDARYDPRRNCANPELERLMCNKIEADLAWLDQLKNGGG